MTKALKHIILMTFIISCCLCMLFLFSTGIKSCESEPAAEASKIIWETTLPVSSIQPSIVSTKKTTPNELWDAIQADLFPNAIFLSHVPTESGDLYQYMIDNRSTLSILISDFSLSISSQEHTILPSDTALCNSISKITGLEYSISSSKSDQQISFSYKNIPIYKDGYPTEQSEWNPGLFIETNSSGIINIVCDISIDTNPKITILEDSLSQHTLQSICEEIFSVLPLSTEYTFTKASYVYVVSDTRNELRPAWLINGRKNNAVSNCESELFLIDIEEQEILRYF